MFAIGCVFYCINKKIVDHTLPAIPVHSHTEPSLPSSFHRRYGLLAFRVHTSLLRRENTTHGESKVGRVLHSRRCQKFTTACRRTIGGVVERRPDKRFLSIFTKTDFSESFQTHSNLHPSCAHHRAQQTACSGVIVHRSAVLCTVPSFMMAWIVYWCDFRCCLPIVKQRLFFVRFVAS